ncbi:MAG: RluA family pseudouridine synthase [Endomicrobiaceae bacterium]|nr:RluA family pseudouridine synthase [Endomicrobiaceae bacterium]
MKINQLDIIFEDSNILVVNKKSGICVIAKDDQPEENTLLWQIKNYIKQEVFPVISLDVSASGLVLFAKNKDTYDFISKQFNEGKVKRIYQILVNGIIEDGKGEIDKPLLIDKHNTVVSEKGVDSLTKYEVKEQFKSFAFIEVMPMTTRKNQIRAHFWSIGNPLAIDEVYASSEPILLSTLKRRYKGVDKEKPLLSRLPLHLSKIELFLPDKKTKSGFESLLPDDINITLKQLRKYNKRG